MMQWRAAASGVAIVMCLGGAGPTLAQTAPNTLLHLSATNSVQVTPDQLVAELVAQSTSSSPAEAQRHVNALIAAGLQTAQGIRGVEVKAVGYAVTPTDEKRTTWTAQQTLALQGADGSAVLDLANRLQEKGFVTAALDWQFSLGLRRKAHDEATTAALKELQERAASAAATLGLHIDHLQDVRLDGPMFEPRPHGMQAMVARAAAPQATAAPEAVTAEVSADVVLRP